MKQRTDDLATRASVMSTVARAVRLLHNSLILLDYAKHARALTDSERAVIADIAWQAGKLLRSIETKFPTRLQ
ncbi:hypothetical protein K2Y11_22480 [bacterium]|nr:hypothetical protein [bacterium]